jgi:3-dehydroquinate dehydratase type I
LESRKSPINVVKKKPETSALGLNPQHNTSESVKKRAKVAESMPNPKICVSLEETTVKAMVDEAARAGIQGANMIEVRFDRLYLKKPQATITEDAEGKRISTMPSVNEWPVMDFEEVDVEKSIAALKEAIALPVIFSVRSVRDGGHFSGDEKQRLVILQSAIESEVKWIDLELSIKAKDRKALVEAAQAAKCQIIASQHDMNGTPSSEDIVSFVTSNADSGDLVKFCSTLKDHQDALQLVDAANTLSAQDSTPPYSIMALGNGGDWTRIHAPTLGQDLVYATMRDEFRLSDKGLVNVRDLQDAWRLLEY